jgi:hypothetical protein
MARQGIGFGDVSKADAGDEAVKKMFTPEFRNRLDAIVPFAYLGKSTVSRVVDKFILQLELQLAEQNVHIQFDSDAREWLADKRAMTSSMAPGRWPADPGQDQAAAGRGTAVRQAGRTAAKCG